MKVNEVKASRKRVSEAYQSFHPNDLIIRDLLALDRTTLANERTLLAYIRTSFVLGASGLTLIKLLPENMFMVILGYLLLPLSFITLGFGYRRFHRTRRALLALNEHPENLGS